MRVSRNDELQRTRADELLQTNSFRRHGTENDVVRHLRRPENVNAAGNLPLFDGDCASRCNESGETGQPFGNADDLDMALVCAPTPHFDPHCTEATFRVRRREHRQSGREAVATRRRDARSDSKCGWKGTGQHHRIR